MRDRALAIFLPTSFFCHSSGQCDLGRKMIGQKNREQARPTLILSLEVFGVTKHQPQTVLLAVGRSVARFTTHDNMRGDFKRTNFIHGFDGLSPLGPGKFAVSFAAGDLDALNR